MVDVEKLNDTIEELENGVENIKKITNLIVEIDKVSDDILINNEAYETVVNDLKSSKKKLEDISSTVDGRLIEMQNENMSFNKKMAKKYNLMEDELLNELQAVKIESKRLYLEVIKVLKLKLDKNKLDIEEEVRSNVEKISTQLKNENLDKKLKKQDILLYAAITIIIINTLMILYI